jgi:NAD(P)-dependent dehydrogenase (short-subunit alcohol dehydrogenase family)
MRLDRAVALVTAANRGTGAAIASALLEHGASKVYAAARVPMARGSSTLSAAPSKQRSRETSQNST